MGYDKVRQLMRTHRTSFEVSGSCHGLVPGELASQQAYEVGRLVFVLVALCHIGSPSATNKSVSLCMPLAIRALIVPIGEPSRSAISAWVSPEK